ncbi:hypothetical protein [Nocardioides ungokensis]|uniref:hypothetical protein n=1 Tax=Nocardioides ungokensis TaxID=1643322 RepID=UPI0015DFE585|nr:hypothetical protein [Nocardioides ungokensis]
MSPQSADRNFLLRLPRYTRDRLANRRLLSALRAGEPIDWRRLDSPARVTRRLLELGLDSYVELLFDGVASGSHAYLEILRATRHSSAPSLLRGHAAAAATGRITGDGEKTPTGTGFLIGGSLMMTSERVLSTPDVAKRASLVLTTTEAGAPGTDRVPLRPDDFFYSNSDLGIAVSAVVRPTGAPSARSTISVAGGSTMVVGERASQLCAEDSGVVQVHRCLIDLRHGRFLQYAIGDGDVDGETLPPPGALADPGTAMSHGAPMFDAGWNLVAMVRDAAGDVGEAVEAREIEVELRRVGEHYGAAALGFLDDAFRVAAPVRNTSPSLEPDVTEVVVPVRVRISVASEPPPATRTESEEEARSSAGTLAPLPIPGIDLNATSGPGEVPSWTNEGALGRRGAEHFFRAQEHFAGQPDESRLWYWGTRLLLEARRRPKLRAVPGYVYTAAGFLDPHAERNPDGYFGLIVYTTSATDSPLEPRFLSRIDIDGERFPVVVRPTRFELQAPTVQPADGWSSCWARTKVKSDQSLGPGILTAQHVYPQYTQGQRVPLANGTYGRLLDVAPPGIDAAIVETSEAPPPTAGPMTLTPYVAAGSPVTMQLRGRLLETVVVETNNTFLIFNSAALPLRIGFQHAGTAGDSGGLVLDHTGAAIGIYLGMAVNVAEQRLGLAQHLFQASEVMGGMEVLH